MPKISQLPQVTSLGSTDVIPVVQGGTTYGVQAQYLSSPTPYGSFSFTGSQVIGAVSASVSMSTTTFANGISIDATQQRLTVTNAGKYLVNGKVLISGSAATFYGWLRTGAGGDVALSTFGGQPDAQANPYRQTNFSQIVTLTANDTIQLIISGGGPEATVRATNNAAFPSASALTINIHQVN